MRTQMTFQRLALWKLFLTEIATECFVMRLHMLFKNVLTGESFKAYRTLVRFLSRVHLKMPCQCQFPCKALST